MLWQPSLAVLTESLVKEYTVMSLSASFEMLLSLANSKCVGKSKCCSSWQIQTMDEFTVMCVNVRQNANAWDWQDANAFFWGEFRNILWGISNYCLGNFEISLGNFEKLFGGISKYLWGISKRFWQIRNDGKMNFQCKVN